MNTLLIRLSAPMQSWGTQSRFDIRDTGLEPSKSGVIGLICAALGRPRQAPIDDLSELKMGVRVDREGRILRDFHTAGKGGYMKAKGDIEKKNLIVSTRYYLSDAVFLVGLEGEFYILEKIQQALKHPVWSLYLGRKAFPPSEPVWLEDGLKENKILLQALKEYPPLIKEQNTSTQLRLILEDDHGEQVRMDQPISFDIRKFMPRQVRTQFIHLEVP